MPGHKRRLADDDLLEQIYGVDVTETEGFDNLHDAKGILKEAEERAAKVYGSDETHFLVNGSTGGILAAICATVSEGDNVIIAANCHRSVYNAAMQSRANVYIMTPESEGFCGISGGISEEDVRRALTHTTPEGRTAVVVTSPTYEGIASDINAIGKVCHDAGAVFIVDSAHGAHLGFSGYFPESAVGHADVVITSVHKTLPAMTQTALIHIDKDCVSKRAIRKMLTVFMTSSPSYVLMASIDSAMSILERQKRELFEAYVSRLEDLYGSTSELKCLSILNSDKLTAKGSVAFDRSKIVVSDITGRCSGKELYDRMSREYGLVAELAADTYIILMTSIADSDEGFSRLKRALCETDRYLAKEPIPASVKRSTAQTGSFIRECGDKMLSAVMSENVEYVPLDEAEGRIAQDLVSIYPPGIPVVIPMEKITGEAVDKLIRAKESNTDIIGLNEGKIAVLWEKSSI